MMAGMGILTFAEIKEGKLAAIAKETVGTARRLADFEIVESNGGTYWGQYFQSGR